MVLSFPGSVVWSTGNGTLKTYPNGIQMFRFLRRPRRCLCHVVKIHTCSCRLFHLCAADRTPAWHESLSEVCSVKMALRLRYASRVSRLCNSTHAQLDRALTKCSVNSNIKQAEYSLFPPPLIGCSDIILRHFSRPTSGRFDNQLLYEALSLAKTATHQRKYVHLLPPTCMPTSTSRHFSSRVYRSATDKSVSAKAGEGSNGWTHTVVRVGRDGTWERMLVGASSLVTITFFTFTANMSEQSSPDRLRQCYRNRISSFEVPAEVRKRSRKGTRSASEWTARAQF